MASLATHPPVPSTEKDYDVSVIVPAYNAAATIGEQLAALQSQRTAHRFEIIVADNGSTDHTRAITEASHGPCAVRFIDASAVRGSAHARNAGARVARGQVLAFCDADDVVAAGWLDALVAELQTADIVGGRLDIDHINAPQFAAARPRTMTSTLNRAGGFLPFVPTGNFAVRRSTLEALGGLNESYIRSHDVEFSWRAQIAGLTLGYAPNAVVHYRYRATGSATLRQAILAGRASAQLFADYRRHGAPGRGPMTTIRSWWWLLSRAPLSLHGARRIVWIRRLGEAIGRLRGSVRFRVRYL